MSDHAGEGLITRDAVAIFHASFHPTKGNIIDWCVKATDDLSLDGVEFSVLPSGLHLVEKDTVYFSHLEYSGLALFRRRPTLSYGHRGFRLSSIGILLAPSSRSRPWLHLQSLQALVNEVYASADSRVVDMTEEQSNTSTDGEGLGGELTEVDWEPARVWFEKHKVQQADLGGAGVWSGWSDELDGVHTSLHTPTLHLPHLLRILGISSLTLYKFVLSRRRILIFTLPPVEVACILAWISADLCREHHMFSESRTLGGLPADSRRKDSPRVLGMVTLSDLERLKEESKKGQGWIACTTDAIFLEKPSYYDLVIDLTTSTPSKSSRPTLYMTKPVLPSPNGRRGPNAKLETVRFTWSDVKLWNELDRILKLDASHNSHVHGRVASATTDPAELPCTVCASPTTSKWSDPFQLYDEVCLLCATLWMGVGTWRSNSRASFSTAASSGGKGDGAGQWGSVRLEGDDDWSLGGTHMRNLGMGIEGRHEREEEEERAGARMRNLGLGIEGRPSGSGSSKSAPRVIRRWSSTPVGKGFGAVSVQEQEVDEAEDEATRYRRRSIGTTLALLQTFHAHTTFLLSELYTIIPPPSGFSTPIHTSNKTASRPPSLSQDEEETETVVIYPKDLLALELGVLSELDARFVEWLAEAEGYSGKGTGRTVIVKRRWKELLGVMLGFG